MPRGARGGRREGIAGAIRAPRELVEALAGAAAHFTPAVREEKLGLLGRLADAAIDDAVTLSALHEVLCFLQAYPDDPQVLAGVDRALEAFPARVKRLRPGAARRLDGSGIAGTVLDYPYGLPMSRWLARRFPGQVEIIWKDFTEDERLQESLVVLLEPTEHDAWSDEGGLGWRRWLDVARAGRPLTDLEVLLEVFERSRLDEPAREWLFESLGLPIGRRLDGAGASRTQARLPWARPFFRGADGEPPLRRPDRREFARELARPLLSVRRAPRPLAEGLIESARLAMATRSRELFAFDHANPDDVLVADLGRGLRIALIGIVPEFRLAFEGYYAYLALENGVPVGYGAGWQLLDVLELAVNVFESFRRGESAFIVSQALRVYRRAFGMRAVVVDPYQIGRDNPEALRSGAFYFYRRLGFRPRDPVVSRLADAEQDKIARDPSYRSPLATLARLARSEIYLPLAQEEPASDRRVTASRLAALVTDRIARAFHGDRQAALHESASRVARVLGASRRASWPAGERRAFEQLSLLVALIPDLDRWSAAERRRLVEVLRAKGGPSEARYVRLLDRHRRLRSSLTHLVTASASPAERGR